jgi:uncharacterized membrane protein
VIIAVTLLLLFAAVAVFCFAHDNDSGGWAELVGLLAGMAAAAFFVLVLVLALGRHYGRVTCHTFGQQTGRQTRFVIYNTFATGDCLTRTKDGRWIPRSNLREFGSKP